jgi:chromosome partitioning protein
MSVGKIVVVGGMKGGSGKSTLACNLAAELANRGHDVVLIDTDVGQATAAAWVDRRAQLTDTPPVHCIQRGGHVVATIRDAAKRYEIVVVDVGGRDSAELRDALLIANEVLIPCQPTQADLEATAAFSAAVDRARSINTDLKARVVFTRASTHAQANDVLDAREVLGQIEAFDLAESVIYQRRAYDVASITGHGVVEGGDKKAIAEIQGLVDEVGFNG